MTAQKLTSTTSDTEPHRVVAANAIRIWNWLQTRGGIAIWNSVNLSNPTGSWTTPANTADGTPTSCPTWQAEASPSRIITNPAEVLVDIPKEVKRFRVGLRVASNGMQIKLTDAASRRVRESIERINQNRANKDAWYEFDYDRQECVIFVSDKSIPIAEFVAASAGNSV